MAGWDAGENTNGRWERTSSGVVYSNTTKTETTSISIANVWGTTSGTTRYAQDTYTQPIEFKTAPIMTASIISPLAVAYAVNIANITTTQFQLVISTGASTGTATAAVVSYGRWYELV